MSKALHFSRQNQVVHNGRIKIEEDLSLSNLTFPDVLWGRMVKTRKGERDNLLSILKSILPHAHVKYVYKCAEKFCLQTEIVVLESRKLFLCCWPFLVLLTALTTIVKNRWQRFLKGIIRYSYHVHLALSSLCWRIKRVKRLGKAAARHPWPFPFYGTKWAEAPLIQERKSLESSAE